MTSILYTYKNNVYVNLTNRCSCNCTFCIRQHKDEVNGKDSMWYEQEPTIEDIKRAIDAFDFEGYEELIYCGYGEPTCALENLIVSAKYYREKHTQRIRVNTNGLGRLYHGRDILLELNQVVDAYSISLNAPTAQRYEELVKPSVPDAFSAVLDFARDSKVAGKEVQLSVVSVLSKEEINQCYELAEKIGVPLKVREYV